VPAPCRIRAVEPRDLLIGGEGAGAPADGCLIPRDSHARIPCRGGPAGDGALIPGPGPAPPIGTPSPERPWGGMGPLIIVSLGPQETGELEKKGIKIHATEIGRADDRQAQGVYLGEHFERLPKKLAK